MYVHESDRTISPYVMEQSRRWLQSHIRDGFYTYGGDDETVTSLFDGAPVGADAYDRFVSCMENNPLRAKILHDSEQLSQYVCPSDPQDVSLYMISLDGKALPIGFVFDFFEDEFEHYSAKQALIRAFYIDAKQDTLDTWNRTRFTGRCVLLQARQDFSALVSGNNRQSHRLLFASLCWLTALVEMILFGVRSRAFSVMWQFLLSGCSRTATMSGKLTFPSFTTAGEISLSDFTIIDYMNVVGIPLFLNFLFFITLIALLMTLYRVEMKRTALLMRLGEQLQRHSTLAAELEKDGAARLALLCDRLISQLLRPTDSTQKKNLQVPAWCEKFRRCDRYNHLGYEQYTQEETKLQRRHSFLPLVLLTAFVTLIDVPFFYEMLCYIVRLICGV